MRVKERFPISLALSQFDTTQEPNEGNIRTYLDSVYSKVAPIEQPRWNEAHIDTLFHAGAANFINRHFSFANIRSYDQFYFNLVQQPINMVTGYQRQHRKSIIYTPSETSDSQTTDQYTKLIMNVSNRQGIGEMFSRACELSSITSLVFMQPYLDFQGGDPAQGDLKTKIWEYNSFLVDPFAREPDFSDAQFIWFQQYITKKEALEKFGDKAAQIHPLSGSPQRFGRFYFLPESNHLMGVDRLIQSFVWYKSTRKKKMLYSQERNQFFDVGGENAQIDRKSVV